MSIQQDFDVAKAITELSPAIALKFIRQAYWECRHKTLATLIKSTNFKKMNSAQIKQLNELLYHAATHNDMRAVLSGQELLKIPVIDVNYQQKPSAYTVLIRALANKNYKFARLLLARQDIDINKVVDSGSFMASAHSAATICTGRFKDFIMSDRRFDLAAHSRLLLKQVSYQRARERMEQDLVWKNHQEARREAALQPLRKALRLPKPTARDL